MTFPAFRVNVRGPQSLASRKHPTGASNRRRRIEDAPQDALPRTARAPDVCDLSDAVTMDGWTMGHARHQALGDGTEAGPATQSPQQR